MHGGREPVCDDDRRTSICEFAKSLEPVCFGPRVEGARRLIENDDWRAPEKRACKRDALPFTDAELCAAREPPSKQRLFSISQARNDFACARGSDCGVKFGVGGFEG